MRWLLFFLACSLYAEFPLERFHVCTAASHEDERLHKLLESCKLHGIELHILGLGKPYRKNGTKLLHMREFLKTLEEDEIVMFVDAFDVLIVRDKKEILEKFLSMNKPFIMAAEKNCAPNSGLAAHFPHSPTPFKYINTGTYIGYVKNIREWLQELSPISQLCDQAQTILHYVKKAANRRFFSLDYHCDLFLPLFMVRAEEVMIQQGKVFCLTTYSEPCVIHANGRSFDIWNQVYNQLVAP